MSKPNRKVLIAISLFMVGFMVLAIVMAIFTDLHALGDILGRLHAVQLVFALACTAMAYLSFALSFDSLFKMTPHRVPFNRFFSIMFISYTVNFIISSGGWAGIALRSYLLRHEKVPYSVTVPISFAQNMVFNLVLACVCFGGLIFLREHPEFVGGAKQTVVLAFMVALVALVAVMLLLFFNRSFRKAFLRWMIILGDWAGRIFLKKRTTHERMVEIRNNLENTIQFLHRDMGRLLLVLFWVTLDWTFTAFTLYFCFHAVGVHLPLGLLMIGFTVMFLTSSFNPVPGGLGISEVALSETFKLLGVGFEQSLVAALLFRFIFFILPMAASVGLYLDTLRGFLKSEEAIEQAVIHTKPTDPSGHS